MLNNVFKRKPNTTVTATVADIHARLAEIVEEVADAESEAQALTIRQTRANEVAEQLLAAAAAGTLSEPARLTEALRRRHELQSGNADGYLARVAELHNEEDSLREAVANAERQAIQDAHAAAVDAYIRALAPVAHLADRVRNTAQAAGKWITKENSPGLISHEIVLNSALIDLRTFPHN